MIGALIILADCRSMIFVLLAASCSILLVTENLYMLLRIELLIQLAMRWRNGFLRIEDKE